MIDRLRELAEWEAFCAHGALHEAADRIEYQAAIIRKLEDALYRIAAARNLHSARAIATVALG